ncbi:hypothetical protein BM221_005589 [Beauveria bassiana]|uniref:Uncharacterized protein n=1 Tax=Beauveria bassiana TaxID=176275 RepID=A0A2N6NNY9_BEABA|nr:hypothetical protein BM221_005589 [Beauveria bassiana]
MTAQLEEPSPILKRSFSTPTVRDMAQDSPTTAGEKKRNKLGYHRTSIACSELSPALCLFHAPLGLLRCRVVARASGALLKSPLLTKAAIQQVIAGGGKSAVSCLRRYRTDV